MKASNPELMMTEMDSEELFRNYTSFVDQDIQHLIHTLKPLEPIIKLRVAKANLRNQLFVTVEDHFSNEQILQLQINGSWDYTLAKAICY